MSILATVLAVACGDDVSVPSLPSAAASPEVSALARAEPISVKNIPGAELGGVQPKLIRAGDLRVQTRDVQKAAHLADSLTQTMGGRVATSQFTSSASAGLEAQLSIRVPSARFDDAVTTLSKLGETQFQKLGTENITMAYTDLETRLAVGHVLPGRARRYCAIDRADF